MINLKYSKKYLLIIFVLGILLFANINHASQFDSIIKGSGSALKEEIWNPVIARSVNQNEILFAVDSKEVDFEENDMYMDENLNLMIPVSIIKKNFQCAANIYDETKLVIEKNTNRLEFNLKSDTMFVNGESVPLDIAMVKRGDEFYVPAKAVADGLNYEYNWNVEENVASVSNKNPNDNIIPYRFDLRDEGRTSVIKNQGPLGTCWAFASLTALESSILPEDYLVLSPDHMSLQNSFNVLQNDGGEYTMAMAYLTSWQGPVLEKEDAYGDFTSPEGLKATKHVQEIQVIEGKNYQKIKEAVYQYGGVQSSLYTSLTNASSQSIYYNEENYAYCFIGTDKPNHDVVIVGWDDNYPKENFNLDLEGDGAFICQNSWGDSFGDDGYFYVSYYDTNIGMHNVVYTSVEDADNYDNIYQSDLCGWVGQLGYGKESAYFANVYTANSNESMEAVGFYATGKDTEYEVYVVNNFNGTESLNERTLVKSGYLENAGYYTIHLDNNFETVEGEKFAVVVKITTPNSIHPIAIEYQADETTATVDLSDGEGYISLRGEEWDNVEENQDCNICLKVYTDNR